jgi:uncharacterized protein
VTLLIDAAPLVALADADLDLSLADCALIVLAARHRTTRILTFHERHFRAVKPLYGRAFTLLPADS